MVLVCLPSDEERPDEALAEGARVAAQEGATLHVLHIVAPGSGRGGFLSPGAVGWVLPSADPVPALRGFVRRHRVRRLVFGPKGWQRWGRNLVNCS